MREHSYPKLKNNQESGIAVGDIVIVRDEKSNRNFWKLAKVVELLSGDDKVVRAAVIRICRENSNRTQLLRRPIKHLVPIEVQASVSDVSEVITAPKREDKNILPGSTRPQRQAAITGQLKRLEQLGNLCGTAKTLYLYYCVIVKVGCTNC